MELGIKGRFAVCGIGSFVCYFIFGILQEKIIQGKYGEGDTEEKFTYILALVWSTRVVNYLYALFMSETVLQQGEDTTPNSYYAVCSFTHTLAMVASNKALSWVSFPTQVACKSCKPIPIMVFGVLVGRKKYPLLKYLHIFMIVVGVMLFMYKDKEAKTSEGGGNHIGMGELLLMLSLICDGLTGAVQERMKSEHGSKSGHMMKAMNLWSMAYLGAALIITGEGVQFLSFVERHPSVLWEMASFAVVSALGQFFLFMCISEFGPLPCSIITTTRKFFTILASVIFFGNSLVNRQWLGTLFVFGGIFVDGLYGEQKQKSLKSD